MTGYVAELMKGPYPELLTTREYVAKVVKNEELRFSSTIRIAIDQFSDALTKIHKTSGPQKVLLGDVMFKFYDTFGLPLDLMQELADETGVKLDEAGFNAKLEAQRERGKASWKDAASSGPTIVVPSSEKTEFVGYTQLEVADTRILAIRSEGRLVKELRAGETAEVFLDKTPFYAETGGQIGDTGTLEGDNSEARVHNTYPLVPGHPAHETKCIQGVLKVGDVVKARVDVSRRLATQKNHTATHLLHASLRNLVGTHVKQAGSLVAPDRLRFDFTHYAPLSAVEISEIENLVNAKVMENSPVTTSVKDLNDAIAEGAMALFGEKYGNQVRVVSIDTFSKELCGGTHVERAGDIGLFKIVSEAGIAAGIRRVEAITGDGALGRFREDERLISDLEEIVRGKRTELVSLVEKHQSTIKTLEKELEELRYRMARSQVRELIQSARVIKDVKVLTAVVDGLDKGGLRNLADELKAQLGKAVVVLATSTIDKVALVAAVTMDLTTRIHAGKLVKEISTIVGGGGGGKPEIAEAGGKDPSQLGKALEAVSSFVERSLAG
jgi:alanyl-tRNA synthetase